MPNQSRAQGAAAVQCEAYWAIAVVLSCTNRFAAMAARLQEFLALAQASHNEPRRLEALALLGIAELEQGQHHQGVRLLDECIPAARALGHARALSIALGARALVHHLRCELTLAEAHYRLGDRTLAAAAVQRADELLPLRAHGAHDMLRPLQIQRRWLERRLLVLRASVAFSSATPERAIEQAASLMLEASGSPHASASARLLLGRAELSRGRLDEAEAQLAAGAAALVDHPAPFIACRVLLAHADAQQARRDPAGAEAALAQVRALIEQIASGIDEPALRALWARASGARLAAASASAG